MNLQKGLLMRIAVTMKTNTMAIFTMNKGPAIALIDGSMATRGNPASRPPAGHSLQNSGSPVANAPIRTSPTKIGYRAAFQAPIPAFSCSFFLPSLTLKRTSCKNPKGHAHPQAIRPTSAPMTVKNPTRAKGNLLCPMKCWSDPIGQAMTASGHAWQLSMGAGQDFRSDKT